MITVSTLSKKLVSSNLLAYSSHQGFVKYFKNTSWMFFSKILRMVAGLFVGVWVARYLGPEKFGIFSYSIAFTALFAKFAKLGLDSIVVRELVKTPEQRDELLGTAFWLQSVGAVVTYSLVFLISSLGSKEGGVQLYILIIAAGMFLQNFELVDMYFQSKVLSKFVSMCKLVQLTFSTIAKVFLVVTGKDLIWFVFVTLFDSATFAVSLWVAYKLQNIGSFLGKFNLRMAKELLKDSWPIILSGLAILLYMKIDQIMIKSMMGSVAVGQYAAAVKISEVWYFIPIIICSSLFPAIVSSKKQSQQLYYARLQKLYDIMVALAVAIALPMTFLSNWIINFMYGKQYSQAGLVLMIHIWAGVFVFLSVANDKWFYIENKSKLLTLKVLAGAVSNVLLNLYLIPKYGIVGAAVATIISYSISVLWSDLLIGKVNVLFAMKLKALTLVNLYKGTKIKNV